MFDINTIVNAAIAAAVQQAIAPLLERIDNLDAICQTQHEGMVAMRDRIATLEAAPAASQPAITIDEAKMVEALNDQEWFWEKMQRFAAGAAEAAMDEHTSSYDHDDYDSHISDDDKHFEGDIEDAVRDAVSNMTFEVSVS